MATTSKTKETDGSLEERLLRIQCELTVKKEKSAIGGRYVYRTAEQIMEAMKPLMQREKLFGYFHDEKILQGPVFHTEYTVRDMEGNSISTQYEILLDTSLNGMSKGQMSGASASYARKYLLCGLFCIDGGDHDLDDPVVNMAVTQTEREADEIKRAVESAKDIEALKSVYERHKEAVDANSDLKKMFSEAKLRVSSQK